MSITLLFGLAQAWLRTGGVSLLAAVPKKVWYGLAIGLALMYFAHWNQVRGRELCQQAVLRASEKEGERVRASDRVAVEKASKRAEAAEVVLASRQRETDDATQAAHTPAQTGTVCLPADLTRRLRNIR